MKMLSYSEILAKSAKLISAADADRESKLADYMANKTESNWRKAAKSEARANRIHAERMEVNGFAFRRMKAGVIPN